MAQTSLPQSGSISLTKVAPFWSEIGTFDPIEESLGTQTKTFYFKSSVSQQITENAQLSNTSGFSLISSSSECKNGFNFTTSNTCILQVKFSAEELSSAEYNSTLTWNGFTINLKAPVNLKIPYFVVTDNNNRHVHQVKFNTMFYNHNNSQSRFIIFKDIQKSSHTTTAPIFTSSNPNFSLSYNCDNKSLVTSGCVVTVNFNSSGKALGFHTSLIRMNLGGVLLNEVEASAQVVDSTLRGTTPSYFFSTSNGEIITEANFSSLSNKLSSSSTFYMYLRDGNKVSSDYISYSLASTSDFTSYYNNCSASAANSASGCVFRLVLNPNNKPVGSYSTNITSSFFSSFPVVASINNQSVYTKSPSYSFINSTTYEKQNSLNLGSYQPSNDGILTYLLVDLNASTDLDGSGVSFSSSDTFYNVIYNNCTNSKNLLNTSGCTIKLGTDNGSTPGTFEGSLSSNLNFNIPVLTHILGNTCTPNNNYTCEVVNGTGTKTCNPSGTNFSACATVSCDNDFHLSEGLCISNIRSCEVLNGQGLETWSNNEWSGLCTLSFCNDGYHHENGQCLNNYQTCPIENGFGIKEWSGSSYGSCEFAQCDLGFHLENNLCVSDVQPFLGLLDEGASSMVRKYQNGEYSNLTTACQEGYHLDEETNTCIGLFYYASEDKAISLMTIDSQSVCPPGYFEEGPSNWLSGSKVCRNRICEPNKEYKTTYLKMENNQVVTSSSSSGAFAEAFYTCNDTGTRFSEDYTVKSCFNSGETIRFLNHVLGTCEEFEELTPSSSTTKVYKYSLSNKFLIKLEPSSNDYFSVLKMNSNACYSLAWRAEDNFRNFECLSNSNLSLSQVQQQFSLTAYSSGQFETVNWSLNSADTASLNYKKAKLDNPTITSVSGGFDFNLSVKTPSTPELQSEVVCSTNEEQYHFECVNDSNPSVCNKNRLCKPKQTCYQENFSTGIYSSVSNGIEINFCTSGEYSSSPNSLPYCPSSYHYDSIVSQCVPNRVSCDNKPANVSEYYKTWLGEEYSACYVSSCVSGYSVKTENDGSKSCISTTVSCETDRVLTGTQSWIGDQYGTCSPVSGSNSCKSGYTLYNGNCIVKLESSLTTPHIKTGAELDLSLLLTGEGNYSITFNNPSMIGSFLVGTNYTSGFVADFGSPVTETISVSDASSTILINITVYPSKANCSDTIFLNEQKALTAEAEWIDPFPYLLNDYSESQLTCKTVTSCINTHALDSVEKICKPKIVSCPNSEIVNRDHIDLFTDGVKTWLGTEYSVCNPVYCESNSYNLYKYESSVYKCENTHLCSNEEIYSSDSTVKVLGDILANANYFRKFFNNSWKNCALDLNNRNSICQRDTVLDRDRIFYDKYDGRQYCITACSESQVMANTGYDIQDAPSCVVASRTTNSNQSFNGIFNNQIVGQCTEEWKVSLNKYECIPETISCIPNYTLDSSTPKPRCIPDSCILGNSRVRASECEDPELKSLVGQNEIQLPSTAFVDMDETKFHYHGLSSISYPNAKCYDGSQGGFFYRKGHGSGSNRWVITLQGGGACGILPPVSDPTYIYQNINDNNICSNIFSQISGLIPSYSVSQDNNYSYQLELFTNQKMNERNKTNIAYVSEDQEPIENSKKNESGVTNLGIISYKKNTNPDFYSWNHIIIKYCSQDAWVGDGGNSGKHNGSTILFSVLDFLKNNNSQTRIALNSLSSAKQVIVTGYSAGAIGLAYYGDHLIEQFAQTSDVSFLIDSGELPRVEINNHLTYEQVFNYNGINLWNKYNPLGGISSNPNLSFFVSDTNIQTKTFIIQDLLDHEFLNYNSSIANSNTGNPPTNPNNSNELILPGQLPEIYPCIGSLFNNSSFNDVLNFVSSQYNVSGNLLLNKYDGLIYSNGIHTYGLSQDWSNSRGILSIELNSVPLSKNPSEWFSYWYFNLNSNTPLKGGYLTNLNSIELEDILEDRCQSTPELQTN